MPRITPGFHVNEMEGSTALLVYEHPAAEVAAKLPGWYRFHEKVEPFREVLVEWAPGPDEKGDGRPQSALLCRGPVEEDEAAPYIGSLDAMFFTYQGTTDWALVRVVRGGTVEHELYWGPDHTPKLLEAGLQPPPLDPGEIAVTVGEDQVRYKGPMASLVCELASQVTSSRELVDRLCREAGIGVPSPLDFPDVDYNPEPGDDRDPQLSEDVVDCWVRP